MNLGVSCLRSKKKPFDNQTGNRDKSLWFMWFSWIMCSTNIDNKEWNLWTILTLLSYEREKTHINIPMELDRASIEMDCHQPPNIWWLFVFCWFCIVWSSTVDQIRLLFWLWYKHNKGKEFFLGQTIKFAHKSVEILTKHVDVVLTIMTTFHTEKYRLDCWLIMTWAMIKVFTFKRRKNMEKTTTTRQTVSAYRCHKPFQAWCLAI